jgi:hypothetical protein
MIRRLQEPVAYPPRGLRRDAAAAYVGIGVSKG